MAVLSGGGHRGKEGRGMMKQKWRKIWFAEMALLNVAMCGRVV